MTPVKLEKALIICSYTEMPLRNSRALINCKSTTSVLVGHEVFFSPNSHNICIYIYITSKLLHNRTLLTFSVKETGAFGSQVTSHEHTLESYLLNVY
jgi:hypothetical protein